MLCAYFYHSRQSQVEYNCALIKVDWLVACIALFRRCFCHFPPALANNWQIPPANGKKGPIPEEMSQTLLTNKQKKAKNPGLSTRH
jgi:hypothetical protein